MKPYQIFSSNKNKVHTILLFAMIAAPLLMFFAVKAELHALILFGLILIILSNLISIATK